MDKPHILQVGPYPDWDQMPLDAAFHAHRYFESDDKAAFLAEHGPKVRGIATRGELGANAAMIAACPHLEIWRRLRCGGPRRLPRKGHPRDQHARRADQ